ncbi:hypothetical protein NGM10_15875 (plasmid) [Halorussus salilacus]|uniref:hypothetical protein n=1 Tax=Halorussus salilacus TaxID=2953750 RepID=UPI0020A13FD7|nr:hypothetical protein [Halorussus salilacus]USZ69882.1 hypothetical protein NGM10_15875 [Halorussus salilacus]
MRSNTPEETPCPVCGEPYDERIVVERGDRWADAFGGPPLSVLAQYRRWCASERDAERETVRGEGERVVYFHDDRPAAGR